MVELTYGPKKPSVPRFVPDHVKLDGKILRFDGVIREEIHDWGTEKDRVHFVNVLYYLETDTIKVIEPKVPNSGLYQGTMFQRDRYLHPSCKRYYHWKDLNVGEDIHLFGKTIHLYDCDLWTRAYLTEQGIEVNEPEARPNNPILDERKAMEARHEFKSTSKSNQFYTRDGKVLRFYGILKDDLETPMGIRNIVLRYYLGDNTIEITEDCSPNCGRGRQIPPGKETADPGVGSWVAIIKRQRILVDRKKDTEKIPCYLEPGDEDDVVWISPTDLRTGEDLRILGKTFFLNKCDDFTRQYYQDHYNVALPQVDIIRKMKPVKPMVVPTHEIGLWDETLRDCYKPHAKTKGAWIDKLTAKPKDVAETVLRFSAFLDTPRKTEQDRVFVISYFMEDDTVKIDESRVANSGHPGGTFLARCRLRKDLGKTLELTPSFVKGAKPEYYKPCDFYIGAKIRASGCVFVIKDADLAVFQFMKNHPEIYPDINPKEQQDLADYLKGYIKPSHTDQMRLLHEMKREVLEKNGSSVFPYPKTLNLGSDWRPRRTVEEELVSANLPISQITLQKLVDAFSLKDKTDVNEVKTFITVALGHDRQH